MKAKQTDTRKVLLGLAARAWVFRWHVILAVVALVVAKLAAVAVPMMLKRIVDAMGRPEAFATLPVALLAGYAAMRFTSTPFTELRDLAFARAAPPDYMDQRRSGAWRAMRSKSLSVVNIVKP